MVVPVRLLVADDTDAVRSAIRTLLSLEEKATICGEATSCVELSKLVSKCGPEVVLIDVHMPDEKQYDPEWNKSQLRDSCLLAMSSWDDEETIRLAETFGAFKLLNKADLDWHAP
jgi:DNA-binding NarL/FixJ family response regulator